MALHLAIKRNNFLRFLKSLAVANGQGFFCLNTWVEPQNPQSEQVNPTFVPKHFHFSARCFIFRFTSPLALALLFRTGVGKPSCMKLNFAPPVLPVLLCLLLLGPCLSRAALGPYSTLPDSIQKKWRQLSDTASWEYLDSMGLAHRFTHPELALNLAELLMQQADSVNSWEYRTKALSISGSTYRHLGEFEKALESQLQSVRILEEVGQKRYLASALNSVGITYKHLGKWEAALPFYKRSLQLCRELEFPRGICMTLNNVGTILDQLEQFDSSLVYYNAALELAYELDLKGMQANCLNNIGGVYSLRDEFVPAKAMFEKAVKVDQEAGNDQGVILTLINLGHLHHEQGLGEQAIAYGKQALAYGESVGATADLSRAYRLLFLSHHLEKNYEEALNYHLKYIQNRDSLLNIDKQARIEEIQTRYETEKKEKENLQLAQQVSEKQYAIERAEARNRLVLGFGGGLLLFLVVVGGLLVNRNRLKQQAILERERGQLQQQQFKAVIDAEEKERKRIARELHDGLGQLLSTAKLHLTGLKMSMASQPEQASTRMDNSVQLLNQAVGEVRSISHNLMPGALINLGLLSAVRELIANVNEAGGVQVEVAADGLEKRLEENVEIAFYRIIQEFVNNSIKHSGAQKIRVQLQQVGTKLALHINDDGKGIAPEAIQNSQGIGWKNIYSRVALLNGEIDISSKPNQGTSLQIALNL